MTATMSLRAPVVVLVALAAAAEAFVSSSAGPAPRTSPLPSTTAEEAVASTSPSATTTTSASPIFEHLKFDGAPSFDVIEKTKEYVSKASWDLDESIYDDDYVLRGPVVGPINRQDLIASQTGLGLREAFPDINIDTFGYTIDPENPYRCFYFQRWRATHAGDLDAFGDVYSATGVAMEAPVSVFTAVWTPEGKLIYEQVGAVVDRFEGNTQGKAAVFALLHTAGLKLSASVGSASFRLVQRLGHLLGGRGRSWSKEDEIPKWWSSTSRGADGTDQW